jgi:hypothetical protein
VTAPDQCCKNVKKALAMAPSTRDPKQTWESTYEQSQSFGTKRSASHLLFC